MLKVKKKVQRQERTFRKSYKVILWGSKKWEKNFFKLWAIAKQSLIFQIYWCQLQIYDKKENRSYKVSEQGQTYAGPLKKLQGLFIVMLHQNITSWEKRTLIPEANTAQGFEYITGLSSSPTFLWDIWYRSILRKPGKTSSITGKQPQWPVCAPESDPLEILIKVAIWRCGRCD